jgi:hypothetical protein
VKVNVALRRGEHPRSDRDEKRIDPHDPPIDTIVARRRRKMFGCSWSGAKSIFTRLNSCFTLDSCADRGRLAGRTRTHVTGASFGTLVRGEVSDVRYCVASLACNLRSHWPDEQLTGTSGR